MAIDYNAKLTREYDVIHDKVSRGMLPLIARNPAIEKATSEYALAQAELYEAKRAKGGHVSIPYRNNAMLDRFANLIMYEELKWSHPDKMSIVEYPITSERYEQSYFEKYTPHSDLQYGDRRYTGRRKTHFTDDKGAPQVRNSRVIEPYDPLIEQTMDIIDLYDALEKAGLTERQREAIDLVYFENMTQEEAAEEMSVSRRAVGFFVSASLKKLRNYLEYGTTQNAI